MRTEYSDNYRRTSDRIPPQFIEHPEGYVLRWAPEHPLATSRRSRVLEQRYQYYEAHGAGPFDCHWCAEQVTWDTLHVDHLDENRKNNAISNLVASCVRCNVTRNAKRIEFNGVAKTVAEWAAIMGIRADALRQRLRRWPLERVFAPLQLRIQLALPTYLSTR